MVKMTSIDLTIDFKTFVEALRLVIEDSSDIVFCKVVSLKLVSSFMGIQVSLSNLELLVFKTNLLLVYKWLNEPLLEHQFPLLNY
jgi:hypothetical protein